MENSSQKRIFRLLLGLLFICSIVAVLEARFKIVQRGYDNFVLDNRNHYLPCRELPTQAEVEGIVAQHQDIIQQIQQVATGSVGVEIDSSMCEGKADLLIWYGTHGQRVAIEEIIAGDTFFGIPYRLQNR